MVNQNTAELGVRTLTAVQVNDGLLMDKIKIKNFYPNWRGESVGEIQNKHDIKHQLRIGTPLVDEQLRKDKVFFILEFLSFNPVNSQIEKRILTPQRIMNKLYVGQSLEEEKHKDAAVFIDGKLVATEIVSLKGEDKQIRDFKYLNSKIKELHSELKLLKAQMRDIYNQDESTNKVSSRSTSNRGG